MAAVTRAPEMVFEDPGSFSSVHPMFVGGLDPAPALTSAHVRAAHPNDYPAPGEEPPTEVGEVQITAYNEGDGFGQLGGDWTMVAFALEGSGSGSAPDPGDPGGGVGDAATENANEAAFRYELNHMKITADLSNPQEDAAYQRVAGELWQMIFGATLMANGETASATLTPPGSGTPLTP